MLFDTVSGGSDSNLTHNEIVSDFVIDRNFDQLRKKVFVKERIQPIAKAGKKPNPTFKSTKFANASSGSKPAEVDEVNSIVVESSNLSAFLDSAESA